MIVFRGDAHAFQESGAPFVFEMLLASPMRPEAIVLGKLLASLTHLLILMICSLPIVMLCLPLDFPEFPATGRV